MPVDLRDPMRYAHTGTENGCVMAPSDSGNWMRAGDVGALLINLGAEITRLRERCEALEASCDASHKEHQRLADAVEAYLDAIGNTTAGDMPSILVQMAAENKEPNHAEG